MSKLDDIPKKTVFSVPERYFDSLPSKIQARLPLEGGAAPAGAWSRFGLRYAFPLAILLVAVVFYFRTTSAPDAEALLAEVPTAELITFLGEADWRTDELVDQVPIDPDAMEALENEIFDMGFSDHADVPAPINLNNFQ